MKKIFDFFNKSPGLILSFCTLYFLFLGWGQDGINIDSATYAVIARHMAEFGSWFHPHYTDFFYDSFAEHPPLVMWGQGLIFLLLEPNDSTARLFGALCTFGSVGIVYLIGKKINGQFLGFLSGLVLLLTYNFMEIGNSTLLDVPMTFFVLVTLYGMISIQKDGINSKNVIITGVALGFAGLSKGVVSAPIWISFFFMIIFWQRHLLKTRLLWSIPIISIGLLCIFLLFDYAMADGQFFKHYFLVQILNRFSGAGVDHKSEWWYYSFKFIKLYLPFIVLLPFGIYLIFKRKIKLLYPVLVTLFFYIFSYSLASKIYYHYFAPVYALSALISGFVLFQIIKEKYAGKIYFYFFLFWICLGLTVKLSLDNIHWIRSKEIYSLNAPVNKLLEGLYSRNGLYLSNESPNWDQIAKIAWYWHSDIMLIDSKVEALDSLKTGRFAYLLTDKSYQFEQIDSLKDSTFKHEFGNERIDIFTLTKDQNK